MLGTEANTNTNKSNEGESSQPSQSLPLSSQLLKGGNELEGMDDDIEKSSLLLEWNCTLKKFDDLSKSVLSKTMRSLKLKNLLITQLRNQNRTLITQNTVKKRNISYKTHILNLILPHFPLLSETFKRGV